jgi:hypothetical protein
MKKIYSFLALFFPALVFLIYDNPPGALIALIMQATVVGWIPASMWAWKVIHESDNQKKKSKLKSKS